MYFFYCSEHVKELRNWEGGGGRICELGGWDGFDFL